MRRICAATLFALVFAHGGDLRALESLTVHSGLLLIVSSEDPGPPNPLVPPFGVWTTVGLPAPPGFLWEAGIMGMGLNYRYEDDRAVLAEVEAADNFWVLGLLTDLRFGRLWRIADRLEAGGSAGLALFLRIPAIPHDNAADDWAAVATFLLARSLFPELAASLRWQVVERWALVFDLRLMYPAHNLWDAGKPSAMDHLTTGVLVGVRWQLR